MNLTEALALLTPVAPDRVSAVELRQIITWLIADRAVTNIAALALVDDSTMVNGNGVHVGTLDCTWTLAVGSTATVDGITCIASLRGNRWMRSVVPSTKWQLQAQWRISEATGDDENTGLPGSPIYSWAELQRRTGGVFLSSPSATVLFLDAEHNEDEVHFYFEHGNAPFIRGTRTVLTSGVATSVQLWSSGVARGELTFSGLPTSWTASGYLDHIVQITSGYYEGYTFVPMLEPSPKRCVFSPVVSNLDYYPGASEGPGPEEGATFDVLGLTHITGKVYIHAASGLLPAFGDIELGTEGAHAVAVRSGGVQFYNCIVRGLDPEGSAYVQLSGSMVTQFRAYTAAELRCYGAALIGNGTVFGGKLHAQSSVCRGSIYIGRAYGGHASQLFIEDGGSELDSGLLMLGDSPLVVDRGAFVDAALSRLWFSGCTTLGVSMAAESSMVYASARPIVFSGTTPTTQVSMGGTTLTLGQLPAEDFGPTGSGARIRRSI